MADTSFIIEGGKRLAGEITLQGAKNSALPILAAAVLAEGKCVIHNCPDLSDLRAAEAILEHLGCKTVRTGHTVDIDASHIKRSDIPAELMREMRSSVIFLGALLGRTGNADITYPGGCELGPRPIDLHISALGQMGAEISEEYGHIICKSGRARETTVNLSFPSVGATENIMLFAARAKGKVTIVNAAREPEIEDLGSFLNKMGAKVSGAGDSVITIEGADRLFGCEHTVIPDRIAAATFMCAAAATGGEITINKAFPEHLRSVSEVLRRSGCDVSEGENSIRLAAPDMIRPVKLIRTMPYPGFPTDAQAIVMAYLTRARGVSVFVENIFESRYRHTDELISMGADITVNGKVCVVSGVDALTGAHMSACDLRGGAALVIAALSARGMSVIDNTKHIERGYERFEDILGGLGASIIRKKI
ncbi:MAG: UDP-N-acetylglucosamine 1-carboxyvinyltransferase [Clostridia bacterium]|nr:UDP-N-acetylglucosamine 1-carboxyvinyltransferase [Clostridia bacterium]